MKILTLFPYLLGVIAETTKPNTGDQTLGKYLPSTSSMKANDEDSYSDSQPPPS